MVAPIVIDLGVADAPRESVQVLIEACSQAAADTECHLVREAPDGPYAAVAIVTWEADDRVRVEVGLRRAEGAIWRSRELTFQAGDVSVERYKSVGFVVGTLASQQGSDLPPPTEPAHPPPEAKTPPPPPVVAPTPTERDPIAPPQEHPRGWIAVSATGGRAVDEGGPRYGTNLRVGVRIVAPLFAVVSAGAWIRPRDEHGLYLSWMDAGLGLGVALGEPSSSRLEFRAEAVLEHLTGEARTEAGVDTNANTRGGARLGADGVVQVSDFVALVGSVEGLGRFGTTEFLVEGAPVGSTTRFEIGFALGARLHL